MTNAGPATSEILTEFHKECMQIQDDLLRDCLEELSDSDSTALLGHLCRCKGCLQKWVAVHAATEWADAENVATQI